MESHDLKIISSSKIFENHLYIARLGADVVDVRPLKPGDDEMHPLRHYPLFNSAETVEHDSSVTTID